MVKQSVVEREEQEVQQEREEEGGGGGGGREMREMEGGGGRRLGLAEEQSRHAIVRIQSQMESRVGQQTIVIYRDKTRPAKIPVRVLHIDDEGRIFLTCRTGAQID